MAGHEQGEEIHVQVEPTQQRKASLACPQCNAKFNRTAHLRRHQMTHRGDKPHRCLYCPVASSRKDVIIRHIRNFHSEIHAQNSVGKHCASATLNGNSSDHRNSSDQIGARQAGAPASPPTTTADDSLPAEESDDSRSRQDSGICLGMFSGNNGYQDGSNSEARLDPGILSSLSASLPGYLHENNNGSNSNNTAHNNPVQFLGTDSLIDPSLQDLNELVDMDLFLFNTQSFLPPPPGQTSHFSTTSPSISSSHDSPLIGKDNSNQQASLSKTTAAPTFDDERSKAFENLTHYPSHVLEGFRFPSKFAIRRFVRVFFRHISPHIPVVHEPTFSIATAASPLLMAILACGATYLGEEAISSSTYSMAMRLLFEHDREEPKQDGDIPLRLLQASILLSYLGIHCGMEQWTVHMFPQAVKRAHAVKNQLKNYSITTYKEWVYQETINRCFAGIILIGATPGCQAAEQCVVAPAFERFALVSSISHWNCDESTWKAPSGLLFLDDALANILNGQPPAATLSDPANTNSTVSDFGLIVLVAAVLYRVCAFEALMCSGPPSQQKLYTIYVETMEGAVQVLDGLMQQRFQQTTPGLPPDPTLQCAKALLSSVIYHLYGSTVLSSMKDVLRRANTSANADAQSKDARAALMTIPPRVLESAAASPHLQKALLRAADQLRFDCQLGLEYLRRVAPRDFGPECAVGSYEGNLLLYWYLEFAQSHIQLPAGDTLRSLIEEGLAEVEGLLAKHDHMAVVPIAFTRELLGEKAVWHWPSSVSEKLDYLINSSKTG